MDMNDSVWARELVRLGMPRCPIDFASVVALCMSRQEVLPHERLLTPAKDRQQSAPHSSSPRPPQTQAASSPSTLTGRSGRSWWARLRRCWISAVLVRKRREGEGSRFRRWRMRWSALWNTLRHPGHSHSWALLLSDWHGSSARAPRVTCRL